MDYQVSVHVHDPAVSVTLADGAPPEDQSAQIAALQAKLDAYVAASRTDAQRIKDRSAPQGNKPCGQYVSATRADAQIIIDRKP